MNVQLKELIEKIKDEGVKEGEEKAFEIKKKAEEDAAKIMDEAKKEADSIISKAQKEAERFENSSKEALKQASRDVILSLKSQIEHLFNTIIKRDSKKALDQTVLKESLVALVKAWAQKGEKDFQLFISEKDWEALKSYFLQHLKEELKKGIEIKPSPQIETGFKIIEKNGNAFYDFTDNGLSDFLIHYLSPKLVEQLKG